MLERYIVEFGGAIEGIKDAIKSNRIVFNPSDVSRDDLIKLRKILVEHFNEEELITLCHDISIEYDDLPGKGREAKARELLAFLERRREISRLIVYIREIRPNVVK